jgi:hypothetical protein
MSGALKIHLLYVEDFLMLQRKVEFFVNAKAVSKAQNVIAGEVRPKQSHL